MKEISISGPYNLWRILASLLIFVYLLTDKNGVEAFSNYHLGRYWHGFLGGPSKIPSLIEFEPIDMWFEQRLDHFSSKSTTTWKQRYFVNDEYYRNDSRAPIFLLVGGEAEAAKQWMHSGAWIKYAEHFGALCFQLEHRFYGQSRPTANLSNANLKYLTSEQALADLSNFVKAMKKEYNLGPKQKWIAFGGSYPGSLVAWFREKYPDLIYGSISSSAPLLAKVDFREYFEVVKKSLAHYNPDCVKAVGRGFVQIEILLKHMIGQRNLDENFNTCTPVGDSINNDLDIANLFENIASNFAGVVQYNKDNTNHSKIDIDQVCNIMMNTKIGPPVNRLAVVNARLMKLSEENCLDYKYDKMIATMQETSWDSIVAKGMRQWIWQTCNEFGFYQTAENKTDTFGDHFKVNFFIKQCMDIYGDSINSEYLNQVVSRTNQFYGGLKPSTTNVLYVHGSTDPWHSLGLTKAQNPKTPIVYIKDTAHCADMYEPIGTDSQELIAARHKILRYLAMLLSDYKAA